MDEKFEIKVLMRLDDQTKIAITPEDHSPGIYITGSQLREIILEPKVKHKQMHLEVLLKRLEEYERNGLARGQQADEWLVIDKKFIVKSDTDNMREVTKDNLTGDRSKKIIL